MLIVKILKQFESTLPENHSDRGASKKTTEGWDAAKIDDHSAPGLNI